MVQVETKLKPECRLPLFAGDLSSPPLSNDVHLARLLHFSQNSSPGNQLKMTIIERRAQSFCIDE